MPRDSTGAKTSWVGQQDWSVSDSVLAIKTPLISVNRGVGSFQRGLFYSLLYGGRPQLYKVGVTGQTCATGSCYLDEAFELVVLRQQLCLFLLQGEDVVSCLLQYGRLAEKER